MKQYTMEDKNRNLTGETRNTTVAGKQYNYWSDFTRRGTFAESEDGKIKQIFGSGYVTNDLKVRKQIAIAFRLQTFRK